MSIAVKVMSVLVSFVARLVTGAQGHWTGSPPEALEQGDSLVIFPEGTRSNKGVPLPFKSGLYHLAEQFPGVQLIPVWIDNVQRVMPKGEVVPVPILCTATFGAPMQLEPGEDKRIFLDRARDAVVALRPPST